MLEISRQPQGEIHIPSAGVTIRALGYDPRTGSIRIGIDAPRSLQIIRHELATDAQLETLERARGQRPVVNG